MAKIKPKSKPIHHWRNFPDHQHRAFNAWPTAESLNPTVSTVERAAMGDPYARAIADAYAFRMQAVPHV